MKRRTFLSIAGTAAGGLLIGLPGCGGEPPAVAARGDGGLALGPWLLIHPDNSTTVRVARVEMGQRVHAALARIIADEIALDWSTLRIEQAPLLPAYGKQSTHSSRSVRTGWEPLRAAGAELRALLLAAAAAEFGTAPARLQLVGGSVRDPADGRSIRYSSLAPRLLAMQRRPAGAAPSPPPRRHIGAALPLAELRGLVDGSTRFGADLRPDGLLHAVIARPPVPGAVLETVDDSRARTVPGFVATREIAAARHPHGVTGGIAVIARGTWAALRARDALDLRWRLPADRPDSAALAASMRASLAGRGSETLLRDGDPDAVLDAADRRIEALYELPFLAHMTMEPMNCIARVVDGRCELDVPTQVPDRLPELVSRTLGIEATAVDVRVPRLGGGFGRRVNLDYVLEAVLVARSLDAPVCLFWTRADDATHDFLRPAGCHRLEAALDADGLPLAWRHRFTSTAIAAGMQPQPAADAGFGAGEATGALDLPYHLPARSCEYTLSRSAVPVGWWRGVAYTANTFAVESFVDELALAAGNDPIAYRLRLLQSAGGAVPGEASVRLAAVLERLRRHLQAAPPDGAIGIACGVVHGSCAALALRVGGGGEPAVEAAVCVVDCGTVIDPDGARAQLEGGILHGLSAALGEEMRFRDGMPSAENFDGYPLLRMRDARIAVTLDLLDADRAPTGLGEIATPLVAPALANALARATGKRARSLPLRARG